MLSFGINKILNLKTLEEGLKESFAIQQKSLPMIFCDQLLPFLQQQSPPPYFVELTPFDQGDIKLWVDIYGYPEIYLDRKLEMIQRFCKAFRCRGLTEHNYNHPLTYIEITEKEKRFLVNVDQSKGYYSIEKNTPYPLGGILFQEDIFDDFLQMAVANIMEAKPEEISLKRHPITITFQHHHEKLKFSPCYNIFDHRKQQWLSLSDERTLWKNIALSLSRELKTGLCFTHHSYVQFHARDQKIDPEEFCFYYDGSSVHKVVYCELIHQH